MMGTASCLCWDPHCSGTGVFEDVQEHSLQRAELGATLSKVWLENVLLSLRQRWGVPGCAREEHSLAHQISHSNTWNNFASCVEMWEWRESSSMVTSGDTLVQRSCCFCRWDPGAAGGCKGHPQGVWEKGWLLWALHHPPIHIKTESTS